MGHILEFHARDVGGSPPRLRESGHTAEVVLFPGVRYERVVDPTEECAGGQTRRRDKLELES